MAAPVVGCILNLVGNFGNVLSVASTSTNETEIFTALRIFMFAFIPIYYLPEQDRLSANIVLIYHKCSHICNIDCIAIEARHHAICWNIKREFLRFPFADLKGILCSKLL